MSYFEGQEDNLWMTQEQNQVQDSETFNLLQSEIHGQETSPLLTDFSPLSLRPLSANINSGGVVRQEQQRGHARAAAPYARRPQSAQPRTQQHPTRRQVSHSSEPSPSAQYSPVFPNVTPRPATLTTIPIQPTLVETPLRHPPYPPVNPATLNAPYLGQLPDPGYSTAMQFQSHSHTLTPAATIPVGTLDSLRKRFRPRADAAYNIRSKHLTHVCELPGVKRSDIKLSLAICIYNGIRVIELEGISRPFFPFLDGDNEEGIVRERHHGKFYRMFPVPFDTTAEDIVASMADGLLILRVHCRSAPNSKAEVEVSRQVINILS